MDNITSNITGFVKANFFKIMGVFLIIGLIQYACSDKQEPAEETTPALVTVIDRFDEK